MSPAENESRFGDGLAVPYNERGSDHRGYDVFSSCDTATMNALSEAVFKTEEGGTDGGHFVTLDPNGPKIIALGVAGQLRPVLSGDTADYKRRHGGNPSETERLNRIALEIADRFSEKLAKITPTPQAIDRTAGGQGLEIQLGDLSNKFSGRTWAFMDSHRGSAEQKIHAEKRSQWISRLCEEIVKILTAQHGEVFLQKNEKGEWKNRFYLFLADNEKAELCVF
ncbi:MAG: hypothetical protein AAB606_00565 [Patescibacteria group bacterium]